MDIWKFYCDQYPGLFFEEMCDLNDGNMLDSNDTYF